MNDLLFEGIEFFNAGRYYEAHERWEDLWRDCPEADRRFCQGLVQVAVGLLHLSKGNRAGGSRVLNRGVGNLAASPGRYLEIDSASLLNDLRKFLEDPTRARAPKIVARPQ